MDMDFDQLNQRWNLLRTRGADALMRRIPLLQTPQAILMTRVEETPFILVVMFRRFDQALIDTQRGTPMVKKFLLDWVRGFGVEAQIQRSDDDSLIIRIIKSSADTPVTNPAATMEAAPVRSQSLANITSMRKAHAD